MQDAATENSSVFSGADSGTIVRGKVSMGMLIGSMAGQMTRMVTRGLDTQGTLLWAS